MTTQKDHAMSKNNLVRTTPSFGIQVSNLDELERVAIMAAKSGFFKNAQDTARGCMIMQYGIELGMSPIAALQNIDVIEGKLSMSGSMIAAKIKSSGRYDFKPVEASTKRAEILFLQNGKEQGTASYSWEDAQRAKLAGKFNWKSYPEDMLWWRCMARGARRFCPDVFLGKVYTPEELSGGEELPDGEIVVSASVATSTSGENFSISSDTAHCSALDSTTQAFLLEGSNEQRVNGEQNNRSAPAIPATPDPTPTNGGSSVSIMRGFIRAVDSCTTPEELDDVKDCWDEQLGELPRGQSNCFAYWQVAADRISGNESDQTTMAAADQVASIKN